MLPETVDYVRHGLLAVDFGDDGGHQWAARGALRLGDGVQDLPPHELTFGQHRLELHLHAFSQARDRVQQLVALWR